MRNLQHKSLRLNTEQTVLIHINNEKLETTYVLLLKSSKKQTNNNNNTKTNKQTTTTTTTVQLKTQRDKDINEESIEALNSLELSLES